MLMYVIALIFKDFDNFIKINKKIDKQFSNIT